MDQTPDSPAPERAPAPSSEQVPVPPAPSAKLSARALPPLVPEQLLLGVATALVMGLTDYAYCLANRTGQLVEWYEMPIAGLYLVAMYLPLGLALGVMTGALLAIVRGTPWLDRAREIASSPRAWAAPRPEAFATTVAALVSGGLFVLAVAGAHIHFATRYHRADLASYALGAAVLGLVVVSVVGTALIAIPIRALARRIGRVASLATLALVVVLVAIIAPSVFLALRPEVVDAYGSARIAWTPAALIAFASLAPLIRRALRTRAKRAAWLRTALAITVVVLAFVGSARTYADSNRVRSVVERRSVMGLRLVRFYQRFLDADADGHPWGFGGQDCDDTRADVYPGANDPEGDGIDQDCFAGDGSPRVAEEGDGRYGQVPASLVRPNFLVITIDALRPDHLGLNGYERPTSPNLDRFAENAVVFERALAPSSRSLRSIPAMWTGLYPSQVAYGGEFLYPALLDENVTVAESLGRRGYRRNVVMGTDYFMRCEGFFQGFDDVDQIMIYKPPRGRPVDDALPRMRALAGETSPWMLWVHLFNVHGPWLPDGVPSAYGAEHLDAYDTEVGFADEQVQRLLDAVHELGLDERTVIVIASDHGEQFYEHGELGHASTLFEEEVRATLMIRAPGIAPRRVPEAVSMIDIAPTLLNLAGVQVPRAMPARSLVPLMQGEPADAERRIFGELVPDGLFPFDQRYLLEGDDKLIWWVREGTYNLFDLAEDPHETNDLSSSRRDDATHMLGLLRAWVAQAARPEMRTDEVLARNRLDGPPATMSTPLDIRFPGMFTLLGVDLPSRAFAPGEAIPLDLYYRVDAETDLDLFFRIDIHGPAGYRVLPHFHGNHFPMHSRYHTDRWRAGEHLRDPVPIVIPPDQTAPATLTLTLSVWVPEENNRALEGMVAGRPEVNIRLGQIELRAPGATEGDPAP